MPMMEVIHAAKQPATREQKRAFTQEVVEIFREVLETPDGRLRVFFHQLEWEDGIAGLLEDDSEPDGAES